jgi:hypothetical protein
MSISQTKGLRAAFGLPVLLYSPIRNHLSSLAPTGEANPLKIAPIVSAMTDKFHEILFRF